MFGLQKATQVTSAVDDPDALRWLADHYAYPERPSSPPCLPRPYLRANMVCSVDGAVTHNDRSGDLAGPGDHAVFRVLRALADAIIVGARTAVMEGYRQPAPDAVFTGARAGRDQTSAPALVLMSRSLSIPPEYPPLSNPDTVVVTCRSASDHRRAALTDAGATVVDCGDDGVDIPSVLDLCAERGWVDVLTEGGPTLLGSVIDDDVLDELCVTTSPTVVAGGAGRIAHHPSVATLHPMRPETIITDDDGFMYTRWTRVPVD